MARIRGADGAFVGGSVAPANDLAADLGGPQSNYANVYVRLARLAPVTFASLPTCDQMNEGAIAYVKDARSAPVGWHSQVDAGGGSHRTFVQCQGSGWLAF